MVLLKDTSYEYIKYEWNIIYIVIISYNIYMYIYIVRNRLKRIII